MQLANWKQRELKPAPPLTKMVGPSLILLGLGLGSGEVILWPYLSANWGLGIIWAALLGISMQFFLNMEVERYALVRGESVFVGLARLFRWLPVWFIVSTFIGFGWPGIIASSAGLIGNVFNWQPYTTTLAITLLVLIGLILSLGSVVYKTVETYQKIAIGFSIPFIAVVVFLVCNLADWQAWGNGLIGLGDGYRFIPSNIQLFTFLGALAYAGAGGNLNLAQSFYVKDKGYGMGAYAQKITSLIFNKNKAINITGATFAENTQNKSRFQTWWKRVNLEHGLVFWLLGFITISMLSVLAFATTYGQESNATGIQFILNEAGAIGATTVPAIGTAFLLVAGLMLFGTQLTVLDSTSRIITENILLLKESPKFNVSAIYYLVLWLQILFGIAVFLVGFTEPKTLVVLGSVINALAMFVGFALILWLNNRLLPKFARPVWWRQLILVASFAFFGYFSFLAINNAFFS